MPTKDVFGNSIDLYSDTSLYYGPVYVEAEVRP
jgi:hypothetical protein